MLRSGERLYLWTLRFALVGLAVTGSGCGGFESTPEEDFSELREAVYSTVDSLRLEFGIPAVTVAWARDSEPIQSLAVGVTQPGGTESVSSGGRVLAGSIGKSFVAATVLGLAAEQRIGLDDRLASWLGQRAWFKRLPNAETATLRHLLTHSAGIPDHLYDEDFQTSWQRARESGVDTFGPDELVGFIVDDAPLFPAGEGWSYSDTGYLLLGMVIEEASGVPLFAEVSRRFLDPLGLDRTAPSDQRELEGLVPGWVSPDNPFGLPRNTVDSVGRMVWNPAIEGAGGGLVSHPADLVRWSRALMRGEALPTTPLDAILEGVRITDDIRYGKGWVVATDSLLGEVIGHAGSLPGYLSSLRHYRRYDTFIAFQMNTDGPFRRGARDGDVVRALEKALVLHLVR